MKQPRIMFFDIETCPCLMWGWRTGEQRVEDYQILEPTRIICISYKFSDEKKIHNLRWDHLQCDRAMMKAFSKVVSKADVVMGHNGKNFDVKHVNARIAFHKLPPADIIAVEDTLLMVRKAFNLPSFKLNYIAKYFNIGQKLATGGIGLWLNVWRRRDKKALDKMVKYCDMDVKLLEKVFNRIKPYVKTKMNVSVYNDNRGMCPSCGGKLHKHDQRFITEFKKVQRYRCQGCGKIAVATKNLLAKTTKLPRSR